MSYVHTIQVYRRWSRWRRRGSPPAVRAYRWQTPAVDWRRRVRPSSASTVTADRKRCCRRFARCATPAKDRLHVCRHRIARRTRVNPSSLSAINRQVGQAYMWSNWQITELYISTRQVGQAYIWSNWQITELTLWFCAGMGPVGLHMYEYYCILGHNHRLQR